MQRCECPYCLEPITSDKVQFFIRKPETDPENSRMWAFLKPARETSSENKFANWWRGYGREIPADILQKRIIKSRDEIVKEQGYLAAEAEKIRNGEIGTGKTQESGKGGRIQPGSKSSGDLGKSGKNSVIGEIRERKKEAGQVMPVYEFYEDGRRIAVTKLACPSCNNLLPDEMFNPDIPVIKIALAASQSGGKTCLALSWFRTLIDKPLGGGLNSHARQMDFMSMLEEDFGFEADDEFSKMLKEFMKLDICPPATNEYYIPPIFLLMKWHQGSERKAIIGIYDAAGETITGALRGGKLVDYMSHMDGIIYLIEPAKAGLKSAQSNSLLFIEKGREKFYKNSETGEKIRMLDPSEQMRMQSTNRRTETLEKILARNLVGESAARDNRSLEVLVGLQRYVNDAKLKKIPVALTLSKCDELKDNSEIAVYDEGNLFLDKGEGDTDINRNTKNKLRNDNLERLFGEKIFNLDHLKSVFKSCSYHMIAALGCPSEVMEEEIEKAKRQGKDEAKINKKKLKSRLTGQYSPIRVEEPLLKLISLYAEENGWDK